MAVQLQPMGFALVEESLIHKIGRRRARMRMSMVYVMQAILIKYAAKNHPRRAATVAVQV